MALTLEQLQAYRQRLVNDVQRVNAIDPGGLNRNTPLVRNLENVEKQIQEIKKNSANT